MARDHFVSQVHLKQFIDPNDGRRTNAVRKSDLKVFSPRPKDVCAVENGNSNPYLVEERLIERLLAEIEPAYEPNLQKIRNGCVDGRVREVFGGFAAAVMISAPTFRRLARPAITRALIEHAKRLHEAEPFPPFPISGNSKYDGKSLPELIESGLIKFNVDMQMPQAMVAAKLGNLVNIFTNCDWEILQLSGEGRLLTSDFPFALLDSVHRDRCSRFMPLSVDLGIVFHNALSGRSEKFGGIQKFEVSSKSKVAYLNRSIVKSAEDVVFCSTNDSWFRSLVHKYRNFRLDIDPVTMTQKYTSSRS